MAGSPLMEALTLFKTGLILLGEEIEGQRCDESCWKIGIGSGSE